MWNDRRVRAVLYQVLTASAVALVIAYLVSNTVDNLTRRAIGTGFDFLALEAGFAIGEHLIPYSAASTYGRAFIVGILNTLKVALIGIVLASLIGMVIGIARLSGNWLMRQLAGIYVETVRNVPLLLQLFFWYAVITETLPAARAALNPLPGVFLSNRGLFLPVPVFESFHLAVAGALVVGCVAAWAWRRRAAGREARTGRPVPKFFATTGLILIPPIVIFLLGGAPLSLDMPALRGFNFAGGTEISPEFAALLMGLVIYTAGFIAEIVRGGILAVPRGQTEAALAVAIGYPDLVSIANTTLNQTGQAIEAIAVIMAVYLTISLVISLFMNLYNRRIRLVER